MGGDGVCPGHDGVHPLWGKIGDLYGRKGVFLTSIVIFLTGSAMSGAAQTMAQLIGFRALQGLGAGGLLVGALAIIGDLVPPRERGRYQGYMAGVMADAPKIYAKHFTAAELRDMLTFYKTSTGQKSLKVMPQVMTDIFAMIMPQMQGLQAQIITAFQEVLRKRGINL